MYVNIYTCSGIWIQAHTWFGMCGDRITTLCRKNSPPCWRQNAGDLCCVYTKLPGTSAIRDSSAVPLPHVCNIAKTTEQISTPHDLLQWFIFEIIIQLHYFALPFPHSKPTVHKHLSAFIQTNSLFFINSYCIYIYILKTINTTRSVFIMICVSTFPSLW